MNISRIARSPRIRLLVAVGIVILGFFIRQRVSRMDDRFFHWSIPGVKGLVLYLAGDYSRAAKEYRTHFKERYEKYLPPADTESYALVRGDLERAKKISQRNLETDPSATRPLLTLGEIALEKSEFRQALHLFEKVLEKNTDQFDALLLSSVVYSRRKDYGKAIESLNSALRHRRVESRITSFLKALEVTGDLAQLPSEKKPFCLLAHYHRYLRIFDPANGKKAEHYAEKAIDAGDHPADAHLTLGIIYSKQWDTERALQAFLKAIKSTPKHAEALRWASRTYAKRGDLENEYKMIEAAYKAAGSDSFYASRFHHVLTNKLGDYHKALDIALTSLRENPDDPNANYRLGRVYNFLGDFDRSAHYYRRVIQLDQNSYKAYIRLGNALRRLGQGDEAVSAYKRAASMRPRSSAPHIGLAHVYHDLRRYEKAIREYEIGIELGESDIVEVRTLCGLHLATSSFQKAVNCYRKVLARRPNDISAQRLLSDAMKNLNLSKSHPFKDVDSQ